MFLSTVCYLVYTLSFFCIWCCILKWIIKNVYSADGQVGYTIAILIIGAITFFSTIPTLSKAMDNDIQTLKSGYSCIIKIDGILYKIEHLNSYSVDIKRL